MTNEELQKIYVKADMEYDALKDNIHHLEQENKQLKERIDNATEYIKKVFPTDFCEMEYESAIRLLKILGDKENDNNVD